MLNIKINPKKILLNRFLTGYTLTSFLDSIEQEIDKKIHSIISTETTYIQGNLSIKQDYTTPDLINIKIELNFMNINKHGELIVKEYSKCFDKSNFTQETIYLINNEKELIFNILEPKGK